MTSAFSSVSTSAGLTAVAAALSYLCTGNFNFVSQTLFPDPTSSSLRSDLFQLEIKIVNISK